MNNEEKIIALDYGGSRVGVAVSEGDFAQPRQFLKNNEKLISQVKSICNEEGVTRILLGLPENPERQNVEEFKKNLEAELDLPIILWDEVLTTKMAQKILLPKKRKQKKEQVDSLSAAIILQEYLDSNT